MPIKYGERTIIYNKEQTIFTSLVTWLKGEEHLEKNCKYIFLFDDGEICDSDDKWIDFKFYFLAAFIGLNVSSFGYETLNLFYNQTLIFVLLYLYNSDFFNCYLIAQEKHIYEK